MKCDNLFRKIDPLNPRPDLLTEAIAVIRSGGIVVFPATSLYGLAADAENPSAVARVRAMKKRPPEKPILLLVKNRAAARALTRKISPEARCLMEAFWPGGVTLILEAGSACPDYLTAASGTIGLRVPAHRVARQLVESINSPLTGTSANISGQPPVYRVTQLSPDFDPPPDLVLDAGTLQGGRGSTVVDVSSSQPVIIREGTIGADRIFAAINNFRP